MDPAKKGSRFLKIAVIGNYLPRLCGIATFTTDICEALAAKLGKNGDVVALAMNDIPEGYRYPQRVRFEIRANITADYTMASDFLNINNSDVVIVQHEYGIFGGPAGIYLLRLLSKLKRPIITTLHTVIKEPSPEQKGVMLELTKYSDLMVVMSTHAVDMLKEIYGVPEDKVVFIPHGIPDLSFVDPNFYKDKFGVEGRKVLLTFGLLSSGKGIEVMIGAMPAIIKEHPDAVYIVLGATHPHVKRHSGEEYRLKLQRMVVDLGLKDHVIFIDRFVSLEELCEYLGVADIYITPYHNKEHIVSGTLAYALGAGKAIVSTPYWYAEEMLSDGRGILVPFGDSNAFAEKVNYLLSNESKRHAMRKKGYQFCRSMLWEEVATSYVNYIEKILSKRAANVSKSAIKITEYKMKDLKLPEIKLDHMKILTDDTGMLQHATYTTPNRDHGYCTDDNVRALTVTVLFWRLFEDANIIPLMQTYLSFILNAFNSDTGRFRNFMSYDRKWLEDTGSEDSHGRALWSLGELVASAPNNSMLSLAVQIFNDALPAVEKLKSSRSQAFAVIGMHAYLRRFGGDASVKRYRELLATKLLKLFESNYSKEWPWCENALYYSNASLPHALLLSGQWVPDQKMIDLGLESLEWLLNTQTGEKGHLSIVGNDGWYSKNGKRAVFDQQPVDVIALIEASLEAYNVTQNVVWLEKARRCFNWFLGSNDLNIPVCDFNTGGCHDSLTSSGVNQNQGAESTLSWLISLLVMHSRQEYVLNRSSSVKEGNENTDKNLS